MFSKIRLLQRRQKASIWRKEFNPTDFIWRKELNSTDLAENHYSQNLSFMIVQKRHTMYIYVCFNLLSSPTLLQREGLWKYSWSLVGLKLLFSHKRGQTNRTIIDIIKKCVLNNGLCSYIPLICDLGLIADDICKPFHTIQLPVISRQCYSVF